MVCTWREALGRYVPGGRLLGSMYLEGGFRVKGGSRVVCTWREAPQLDFMFFIYMELFCKGCIHIQEVTRNYFPQ